MKTIIAKSFFLPIEILMDRVDFIQEWRTDRFLCPDAKCVLNPLTYRAACSHVRLTHRAVVTPHNPERGPIDELEFISKPGRNAQKIDSQFHGIMFELLRVMDGLTV
jgi:hypothetical protein